MADMIIRHNPTVYVNNATGGTVDLTATTSTNMTTNDWNTISVDVSPGFSWVRDDMTQSFKLKIPGPTGAGHYEMRIADEALRDATKLVQYHAPPLQFNPYVNASDLLAKLSRISGGRLGLRAAEQRDGVLEFLLDGVKKSRVEGRRNRRHICDLLLERRLQLL